MLYPESSKKARELTWTVYLAKLRWWLIERPVDLDAVNDCQYCLCICRYAFTTLVIWMKKGDLRSDRLQTLNEDIAQDTTTLCTLVNPRISSEQPVYSYNLTMTYHERLDSVHST